jgi:hypothetical protein
METMEAKPSGGMFKSALVHGLMISAVIIIISLIFYIAGDLRNQFAGYLILAVTIAGIIYVTFDYRNKQLGGYISYGGCIGYGVLVGLIIGIATGIFSYLLHAVISPELVEAARLEAERNLYRANPNLTDEQVEMALKMQNWISSPNGILVSSILGGAIQGLLISIIGGIFTRRKDPNAFDA